MSAAHVVVVVRPVVHLGGHVAELGAADRVVDRQVLLGQVGQPL